MSQTERVCSSVNVGSTKTGIDMDAVETNIAKLRQMLSTKVERFEYIDRSFFGDYAFDICKLSPLKPGTISWIDTGS